MSYWKSALALLAFPMVLAAQTAAPRFTPESGLWWNPAEDGRGFTIEIQDNVLVILVYGYDTDRTSAFFIGAGPMVGNNSWTAPLDGYTNGQCLTCSYQGRPVTLNGAGGTASIIFDTETRGRLTIGTRVIPIERFNFAHGNPTEKMLGEWQAVLDFSPQTGTTPQNFSPFFGEILTIDSIDTAQDPDQYKGCRPTTSLRRCTAADYTNHNVAGFYDSASDEYVTVVRDRVDQGVTYFLAFYTKTGLSQFDGVVAVRTNPTGADACSPTRTAACFPVRGFRSASKRFVQTGAGPSSADPKANAVRPGVIEALGGVENLPQGLSVAEVKSQYGIDMQALEPRVQALIESMR